MTSEGTIAAIAAPSGYETLLTIDPSVLEDSESRLVRYLFRAGGTSPIVKKVGGWIPRAAHARRQRFRVI